MVVTPSPAATIESCTSGSSLVQRILGVNPAPSHALTSSRRQRSHPAIQAESAWSETRWPGCVLTRCIASSNRWVNRMSAGAPSS